MPNKMLIDASHPEETRVVVLRGNRVQEFDFEAADKKPLRGNIYLAKVIRVEPSLQAAFVEYGGNRHGFLAFAEIHPDYYQIPVADRLALLEEERREMSDEDQPTPSRGGGGGRGRRSRRRQPEGAERRASHDEVTTGAAPEEGHDLEFNAEAPDHDPALLDAENGAAEVAANAPEAEEAEQPEAKAHDVLEVKDQAFEAGESEARDAGPSLDHATAEEQGERAGEMISLDPSGFGVVETGVAEDGAFEPHEQDHEAKARRQDERDEEEARRHNNEVHQRAPAHEDEEEHDEEGQHVEHIGGDAMEEVPYRAARPRRQYKIQEVIKRRQVLLVQVVKEERGNKGAALTTYLSLAGRFSVLMPNTARGGGISRKITDTADRKRLKEIVHDLEVPEGMGVILRTAGATRTKTEVKRDFEYLLRLWESVRELTLRSSAPTLVYEEGSLIKRAIRDLYGHEVEEVIVSGEPAYREAQDFMRMLMPSHARNVKLYRLPAPIFAEAGVEAQLDAMFSNQVTLKSGGYLVINQTEALVAIDVNSGRSTREHNIEDTALRTNLEAADEISRQLRLRDLAGLIVVDFIDMEEGRNNRAVERRIKDALKSDRARIQVGRISHFGLLEMSRQRIRAGVVEGSTSPCPHCAGAGMVRSTASIALHVLRVLEEALVRSAAHNITLRTRTAVALYILNQKRAHLQNMEQRFGVHISVAADDSLTGASYHALERGEPALGPRVAPPRHLRVDSVAIEPIDEAEAEPEFEAATIEATVETSAETAREAPREPRRGRGRGGRAGFAPPRIDNVELSDEPRLDTDDEDDAMGRSRRRRRRRGRGGGFVGDLAQPGADQPSDEGLAFMAQIEGSPAPSENNRRPGGGRGRGPGRWTRSTPLPPEFRAPDSPPILANGAEPEAVGQEPVEAQSAPHPRQERLIETPPQEEFPDAFAPPAPPPSESQAEPVVERAVAHELRPSPRDDAPSRSGNDAVITQADPSQPKKGGWWQRAKLGFGGD